MIFPPFGLLTTNAYTITNSTQFTKDILSTKLTHLIVMTSFNIESLFTNIPLTKTIQICVEKTERQHFVPDSLILPEF